MNVNIAVGAARRLSVDVANLSFRLAMLEAERESLAQLVGMLQQDTWKLSMEDDLSGPIVTIGGDQVAVLDQIITAFNDLV